VLIKDEIVSVCIIIVSIQICCLMILFLSFTLQGFMKQFLLKIAVLTKISLAIL